MLSVTKKKKESLFQSMMPSFIQPKRQIKTYNPELIKHKEASQQKRIYDWESRNKFVGQKEKLY